MKKNFARFFIFAFNLLTLIGGVGLIFAGAAAKSRFGPFFVFVDEAFDDISVVCIAVGCAVAFISFIGLYGAVKEHYCSLVIFGVCLALAIGVESALGVAAFALVQQRRVLLANFMRENLRSAKEPLTLWDALQMRLTCCGVDMPGDWAASRWMADKRVDSRMLPDSCCDHDVHCSMEADGVYDIGCFTALEQAARHNAGAWGAAIGVIALAQIALLVVTVKLVKRVEKPESCKPCF